jgi:SHS2 domain-containing protein
MLPFQVLEHTADIGFEASGASREEVFANAGRALMYLTTDLDAIRPRSQLNLDARGGDPAELLVNWLSEILYRYDAEGWLLSDFDIRRLTDRSISALGRGEKFDAARHQIKLLVKAVTYHQLVLEHTSEGWRARVFVDI